MDNGTPTTQKPENADESGVVLAETSWIDRLTPEELAGLDEFERGMVVEELEFRRKRLAAVDKQNSITLAGSLLSLNAAPRTVGAASAKNSPPDGHSRARSRSKKPQRIAVAGDLHPEMFIDQDSGLVDREKFLQLARKGRFPARKEGRKWLARWGDVQAALRPEENAEAVSGLDELDEMRLRWGVKPRGR